MPFAVVVLPAGLALFWAFGAALARAFWRRLAARPRLRRGDGARRMAARPPVHRLPVERLRLRPDAGAGDDAVGLAGRHLGADAGRLLHLRRAGRAGRRRSRRPARGPHRARRRRGPARRPCRASASSALPAAPTRLVPDVHLRIVQPAIPQDEHWQAASADEIMSRYIDLSGDGKGAAGIAGVTLVIWPESAFPFLLTERPGGARRRSPNCCRRAPTLITGAARAERLRRRRTAAGLQQHLRHRRQRRDRRRLRQGPSGSVRRIHAVQPACCAALGLRQLIAPAGGFSPGARAAHLDVPVRRRPRR